MNLLFLYLSQPEYFVHPKKWAIECKSYTRITLVVNNMFIFLPRWAVEVYTRSLTLARLCATALWMLITSAVRLQCDDAGAIVFTAPHLRPLVPLCTALADRPVVQLNGFQFHPI